MLLILTGDIGIGKTTICKKVISMVRDNGRSCGGILTQKSGSNLLVQDIESGTTKILASTKPIFQGPSTTKYYFNPEGILFGNRILAKTSATLLLLDELGQLELNGEGFVSIYELLSNRKKSSLLVIRTMLLDSFLLRLPPAVTFYTTINNRDQIPQEIAAVFANK